MCISNKVIILIVLDTIIFICIVIMVMAINIIINCNFIASHESWLCVWPFSVWISTINVIITFMFSRGVNQFSIMTFNYHLVNLISTNVINKNGIHVAVRKMGEGRYWKSNCSDNHLCELVKRGKHWKNLKPFCWLAFMDLV